MYNVAIVSHNEASIILVAKDNSAEKIILTTFATAIKLEWTPPSKLMLGEQNWLQTKQKKFKKKTRYRSLSGYSFVNSTSTSSFIFSLLTICSSGPYGTSSMRMALSSTSISTSSNLTVSSPFFSSFSMTRSGEKSSSSSYFNSSTIESFGSKCFFIL